MTGCLRQAHIARNNGVEYHVTQTGSNIICDLLCKAISPIIHGERHTHDGKITIKSAPNTFDRLQKLTYSLQGAEFTFHRNQQSSGEHTSELQALMRTSYAVISLKQKKQPKRK